MGNEASTIINEIQTNIESKLERFQPIQLIRDDPVEEIVPDPPIRRGHEDELRLAFANENVDGQKTFTEAILRAKKTEIPEITEHQKTGMEILAYLRHYD